MDYSSVHQARLALLSFPIHLAGCASVLFKAECKKSNKSISDLGAWMVLKLAGKWRIWTSYLCAASAEVWAKPLAKNDNEPVSYFLKMWTVELKIKDFCSQPCQLCSSFYSFQGVAEVGTTYLIPWKLIQVVLFMFSFTLIASQSTQLQIHIALDCDNLQYVLISNMKNPVKCL